MKIVFGLFMFILVTVPSSAYATTSIPNSVVSVPFYSQFKDISSAKWQKVGCGIASLAMLIDYYKPAVPVNTLLNEAINLGAYSNAGWTYSGLITASKKYGMQGTAYDLSSSDIDSAFASFKAKLASGPVMASVHSKFDPKSSIPHLVIINSIKGDVLYYNDPAATSGGKTISIADFEKGWKKRYIVFRPASSNTVAYVAKNNSL